MRSGTNDLVQKEERVFNAPAWGAAGFIILVVQVTEACITR